MIIGGLQKFSLIDYPEHLSAIIFTQGCNFRCPFCYNPILVWPTREGRFQNISLSALDGDQQKGRPQIISESDLFVFLKTRAGKLDTVVITGGEPTIQPDLPKFIAKIKKLGYLVKVDTNGANPDMLKKLIKEGLVDYLAMDIKAPLGKYDIVVGVQPDLEKIKKSIKIIKESNLPYEFRTTVVPELIGLKDIKDIGKLIKSADKWYLQQFKNNTELLNKKFKKIKPYPIDELKKMRKVAKKYAKRCEIR